MISQSAKKREAFRTGVRSEQRKKIFDENRKKLGDARKMEDQM